MPSRPLIILTAHRMREYRKFPPYGILFVGSQLKKAGYEVRIIHPESGRLAQVLAVAREERPLFVGLSMIHSPLLLEDIEISKALKQMGVPVVWGGVYPSMTPETVLSADYVDYIVTGEAETTAVEFARALEAGESPEGIAGVGMKVEGELMINAPSPFHDDIDQFHLDWDLLDPGDYIDPYSEGDWRMLRVPLSRGCPFKCTFCYNQSNPDRRRFRIHSAEWARDQADYLAKRTGVNVIHWLGDNNFANKKKGMEAISTVGMPWVSTARIDSIEDGFCSWLRESQCWNLGLGLESGSDRVLKLIKKNFTSDDIRKAVALLHKYRIGVVTSWMHLIPGETEDDRRMTRELMDETFMMSNRVAHNIHGFRAQMGIPMWNDLLDMGLKPPASNEEWAKAYNIVPPLFGWTEKKLRRLCVLCQIIYGREQRVPRLVPRWQRKLLRMRFVKGSFHGPVEEHLAQKPHIKKHVTDF